MIQLSYFKIRKYNIYFLCFRIFRFKLVFIARFTIFNIFLLHVFYQRF